MKNSRGTRSVRFFIDNPELNHSSRPDLDFLHNQSSSLRCPTRWRLSPAIRMDTSSTQSFHEGAQLRTRSDSPSSVEHNQLHVSRSQVSTLGVVGAVEYAPFAHEDGFGEDRRLFEIRMLIGAAELIDEGSRDPPPCVTATASLRIRPIVDLVTAGMRSLRQTRSPGNGRKLARLTESWYRSEDRSNHVQPSGNYPF